MRHALPLFVGIILHIFLFSRGEWDRHAPTVVLIFSLLFALLFFGLLTGTDWSFAQCVTETFQLGTTLAVGLFGSMITYRVAFHPLKSFPGPFAARLTSFWILAKNWLTLKFYLTLRKLHDNYGDFIRISKTATCCSNVDC